MSENPRFAVLEGRGVLSVSGPDRVSFLQGLVSNDVEKAGPGCAVYAALLTPQGKFLYDFFIVEAEDALLLDCERSGIEGLKKRLNMYKLRADITLEDRSEDWSVAAVFDGDTFEAAVEGVAVFADPRLAKAGVRCILPRTEAPAILEKAGFDAADETDYDHLRLTLGLPDGSRDMVVEKSTLLESGFDELGGVDWDKGCYMGQELTARTKYRGLVKKRLMPVSFDGPPPEAGTQVTQDGKDVGEVRSSIATEEGGIGLALMRLEALENSAGLKAGDVAVSPSKPDWADF